MNKSVVVFFIAFCSHILYAQDSLIIYFNFDSHTLTNTAKEKLKSISGKSITSIYGFTDVYGSAAYNKILAQRRIDATVRFLRLNENKNINNFAVGEEVIHSKVHKENRRVLIIFSPTTNNEALAQNTGQELQGKIERNISSELAGAKIGDKIKLKSLNFQPGMDVLLPESIPVLEDLLESMTSNPNLVIQIQGHICCTTIDIWDLSTARAKRVHDYLLMNGIEQERLSYKGFGVSQPLYQIPERTSTEEVANRRVEIKIEKN